MKKRWISLLLVFVMMAAMMPQVAIEARAVQSGTCGDNLTWTLDDEGTLTISGTGEMYDYNWQTEDSYAPWYDYRKEIQRIHMDSGITTIGIYGFRGITNISSIDIPNTVTSIGEGAFASCLELTTVSFSQNLTSMGDAVFDNCPALTVLSLPASLTEISDRTFVGIPANLQISVDPRNPALTTDQAGVLYNKTFTWLIHAPTVSIGAQYTIPSTVTKIGVTAFRECKSLRRITIPERVTEVGDAAFSYCTNLQSVSLPKQLTVVGASVFLGCSNLTSVTVPGSIKSIGKWVFADCTALDNVVIDEGMKCIEICMFARCTNLHNIFIPASVNRIASSAFFECNNLKNIYYGGTKEQWDNIYIGSDNGLLTSAAVHYESTPSDMSIYDQIPGDAMLYMGNYYNIYPLSGYTWDAARAYCEALGGHLATITDADEQEFINYLNYQQMRLWIGGYREAASDWRWVTGEKWDYTNWAVGEPNNSGNVIPNENCVAIWPDEWNDLNNTNTAEQSGFICEWETNYYPPVPEDTYNLELLTADNSLSLYKNSTIFFEVSLKKNDGYELNWGCPSVTLSQSNLCDFQIRQNGHRYRILVTGRQPGQTMMTITEPNSGASMQVPLTILPDGNSRYTYRINDVPQFYPQNKHEKHLLTNFYNLKGIYIRNFKCVDKHNGFYHISFDAYNHSYCHGAVDVYSANGQWQNAYRIDRFADITSLADAVEYIGFLFDALTSFQLLAYTNESVGTYTPISFDVPKNGYFTISSNPSVSKGTYIFNAVDLFVVGAKFLVEGFKLSGDSGKTLASEIANEVTADKMLSKTLENEMSKLLVDFSEVVTNPNEIADWAEGLVESFDRAISPYFDWRARLEQEANMIEGSLVTLGGPYGWMLNTLFGYTDLHNTVMQFAQLHKNLDNLPVSIYACESGRPTTICGVEVVGELPNDSVLQITPASPNLEDILKHLDIPNVRSASPLTFQYRQCAYNVQVFYDQDPYELTDTVQINFPTNELTGIPCAVMYQSETGDWAPLEFSVSENLVTVKTRQLGEFSLIYREACVPFTDVPSDSFYYEPVRWAVEKSITNGIADFTFGPTQVCNRAQVVTFLWRAAGMPEPTITDNPFTDVAKGSFYEKAVLWAVEKGITNGADATHFNPNGVCNRAQVVTFLYRTFGNPAVDSTVNPFTDVPADAFYAAPVLWAVENGITNGLSATEFGPNADCNRAQIVTFLYRAYN